MQVREQLCFVMGCRDRMSTKEWLHSNICLFVFFSFFSKTALLEGLEVDQYMWGILNAIQK